MAQRLETASARRAHATIVLCLGAGAVLCHERNYALGNIMRGARLLETEAGGAKKGAE